MMCCVWICLALCPALSAFSFQADVAAKSAVLMNAKTGVVLWEKNAHELLEPGSTTKMATALYAMEKKGAALDDLVVASLDALMIVPPHIRRGGAHPPYRLEFGGTSLGLRAFEVMPLRALIEGLLLVSGNDAANVIAEFTSSSIPQFMEELNAFVKTKGCCHTQFYTPHGLPHPDHKTTAYDLALIARAVLQNKELRAICSLKQSVRPQTNKQPETPLFQFNRLLRPGPFFYPKAIGIKTGFTNAAGYCIVAAAEDSGRELIAVLLGCDANAQRFQGAVELFEKAFREQKVSRTLFSQGFDHFSRVIKGSKRPLQALLTEDVMLDYYPSEEPRIKSRVVWDEVSLPIAVQQRVGVVEILSLEGELLASAPLCASVAIEPTWRHRMDLIGQRGKRMFLKDRSVWMASAGLCLVASSYVASRRRRRKRSMN